MNHSNSKRLFKNLALMMLVTFFSSQTLVAQVWIGGFSDRWFHNANWSDGTIPLDPDDDVVIGAPSPTLLQQRANLNSIVIDVDGILNIGVGAFERVLEFGGTATTTLDNAGTINVVDHSIIQFDNDVINSGTINADSVGVRAKIEVDDGGASITGGGAIVLSGTTPLIANALGSSVTPVLTIGDQTIEGTGNVGGGEIGIVNSVDGLIDANVAGELRVSTDNSVGFVNNGIMRASSGGTLNIRNTKVTSNNIIEALDGSTVKLQGASVTGGTIRSVGSGQFDQSGFLRVEDLVIDTSLIVTPAKTLSIAGIVSNQSDIFVQGPDSTTLASIQLHEDATLTGGGTTHMSGRHATIEGASRALIIGNQTIQGEGTIGRGFLSSISDSVGSVIDANVAERTLEIDASGSTPFESLGTLRASNGGTLEIVDHLVSRGTIHIEEDSRIKTRSWSLPEEGRITGSGIFQSTSPSPNFASFIGGTIAPGDGDATGTIFLQYEQSAVGMTPTAKLEIDIADENSFDRFYVATAPAVPGEFVSGIYLGGTLSVNLEDGFLPPSAATFEIVRADISPFCSPADCTSITRFTNTPGQPGQFGMITTAGGEGTFDVHYGFNFVTLRNFNPANSGSTLDGGYLRVIGSSEIDDIRVSSTGIPGEVQVLLNGTVENFTGVTDVRVQGYGEDDVITVSLAGNSFNRVTIRGGHGDDIITLNGRTPGIIRGDDGNDVIFGGSGPDDLYGDDDIDEIYGRGGADFIDAGYQFTQGPGVHVLEGGDGADVIVGSVGIDEIFGNNGADTIEGLNGDDVINGGLGSDFVSGGPGNDELYGGFANDEINGGQGDDFITGGPGLDDLSGSFGDDEIHGGAGGDRLAGGSGNDELYAGPGADFAAGGSGIDLVVGGEGPDLLLGQGGDDSVAGGGGNDQLSGGAGIDSLNGGPGIDTALDTGETETGIEN